MKKYYYLIFFTFLSINLTLGQTTDRFEAAVKEALSKDQFFTDTDFFGVSAKDSLTINNQFRFAEAARRMHALSIAETAYRRVIRMDSLDKKIDYPTAFYQVGALNKLQGDYVTALSFLEQYLVSPPPINNQLLTQAKKDIDDCKFAIDRVQTIDDHYKISHLGEEINTPFNDFAPLLIGDQLYFSSLKYEKQEKMSPPRLFAKTLISNLGTTATPLLAFNQEEKSVANFAFNKNEERVYYTICDYAGKSRKIRCKIYYQDREEGNTWTTPKSLPNHINKKGFTATQPSVAYDEKGNELLYFASDRPGGKGKVDIWYTKVEGKNTFSKPNNVHQINTPENDLTPFYHQASQVLYFSSNGREGLGGYDIYSYQEGKVLHEGYPLNSSYNDTHFTLDPSGDKGYFSSSREGCLRLSEYDMGCQDIFEAEFINIDLEVLTFDDFTKKALAGVKLQLLEVAADGTEVLIDERINSLDNEFQFDGLKRDRNYRLVASKEGYLPDTINFNTIGIDKSITLQKEMHLMPDIFEMDLTALTFDKETKNPLSNCIVQLIDLETGERFIKDNINSNDFYFDIYSQRDYRLIASLIGYSSDTLDFNTREYDEKLGGASLVKHLFLKPGGLVELSKLLPLTLYFDNDQPNPRSRAIKTEFNYEELYAAYYRKKGEFIDQYTQGLSKEKATQEEGKIIHFFEKELKGNYDTLGVFSETLIKYLQRGQTALISIRGFASPLAGNEYNINLGKRRVDCLMNHFYSYRDGMLMRYIENGNLVLQELSYGETKAGKSISENPKDRRNSVYSPEASRERKVQIVEIKIGEKSEGE
jgi:hypothetical protein